MARQIVNRHELTLWNPEEADSIVHIVPEAIARAMGKLTPEYINLDEETAREKAHATLTDDKLRLSFWLEFDKARAENRMMSTPKIVDQICYGTYFRDHMIQNPNKLAYMLIPPHNYKLTMDTLLDSALGKLKEIIDIPIKDHNGVVDTDNAKLVLQAIKMVDDRVRGMATQNIKKEDYKVELKYDNSVKALPPEQVDAKIKEMEKELGIAKEVIEAEFKDV